MLRNQVQLEVVILSAGQKDPCSGDENGLLK